MIRKAATGLALTLLCGVPALAQTVSSMTDATLPLTNQEYLYIVQNGAARRVHPSAIVPTGLTVPDADLLGGLNNAFTVVTVGANLSLSSGTLSMPVPTADLLGGDSNAFTQIAVGTALEISSGNSLNLTDTAVMPGTYTNTTLTVDQQGRLTAASNGAEACSDVDDTAVIFSNGATCVGDVPFFTYTESQGQVQIINKNSVSIDTKNPAGLIIEAPNVNLHGAIQVGVSNLSGSGAWGEFGFQDSGSGRDGPYTYIKTSDASPIMLGSMSGALGAPRVGINYTDCMIADIQCGHGDLQIYGHREDHEAGSQYWVLVFGDGAATQGGFKIDTSGFGYFELGRSETSNFAPRIHIAENGDSWFNGFGTSGFVGFHTTAPATTVDVNGSITTRDVLSCNSSNAAMQTDATGKLVCGTISGGGGITIGGSTNDLLYKSGASAASGITLTNGQLAIGSTGATPVAANISAGSGITVTNGAGTITLAATGTGGGSTGLFNQVLSTTPTTSSTGFSAWVNQGGASIADGTTGVVMTAPSGASSSSMHMRSKAAPGTPYTITVLMGFTPGSFTEFSNGFIGWYDGTKIQYLTLSQRNTGGIPQLQVNTNNTVTSGVSSQQFSGVSSASAFIAWLQIADDGTNVAFRWSADGANFQTLYTVAKASGTLANYNTLVWGTDPFNAATYTVLMSYKQS